MKKLMTIGLAAAMMFAMAGQASATALETSGEYRARLWSLHDYVASGLDTEYWDMRLRLTMVWPVAEGVKVTARADINEGFWGDQVSVNTTLPGSSTSTTNMANPKKPVDWDQLNLSFNWPNSPVTIVVGRQTTTWGPGFFVALDNRDRFRIHAKFDATTVFYTYDKYGEVGGLHDVETLDDWAQHTIGAVSTVAGWNIGAIVALVNNDLTLGTNQTRYVVDAYGMGKAGPVDIKAELVAGIGTNEYTGAAPDQDVSGFGAYVGATMPAGPVTAGFEVAYVSGNDPKTAKNEGGFASDYQSPFNSIILFNSMDYNGYANESVTGPAPADSGMKNAWGVKPSVTFSLMPGLSLYGAIIYASRIEDPSLTQKADPLGTEVDIIGTYAVTPNVNWTIGGGYLVAGDFYGNAENPWGLMSAFTVKF